MTPEFSWAVYTLIRLISNQERASESISILRNLSHKRTIEGVANSLINVFQSFKIEKNLMVPKSKDYSRRSENVCLGMQEKKVMCDLHCLIS